MTQAEVDFLQVALGTQSAKLLEEIVANNNYVQTAKMQEAVKPKETKKPTTKKESN